MKLANTAIGEQVRIIDLVDVSDMVRRRLLDLGVVEGALISVKKRLPFGGPYTIELNGQWIAIRRNEALRMAVETVC